MGTLTNLSLFSGAAGLDLGARVVGGFRTVCYVEREPYAQAVLMSRMRDGGVDTAPIWSDVTTFDGRPWRGVVDVVSGGFPCQDVSFAGKRAAAKTLVAGTRSGLWSEFARIVREVGPRFILVENVPGLLTGGLGDVLRDLAAMGFYAQWEVLSAAAVGAPHIRERVFVVAHADDPERGAQPEKWHEPHGDDARWQEAAGGPAERSADVADAEGIRRRETIGGRAQGFKPASSRSTLADSSRERRREEGTDCERTPERHPRRREALADPVCPRCQRSRCAGPTRGGVLEPDYGIWSAGPDEQQFCWEPPRLIEPGLGRNPHGLADRSHRLRCAGNGVVSLESVPAWSRIKEIAGEIE